MFSCSDAGGLGRARTGVLWNIGFEVIPQGKDEACLIVVQGKVA